MGGCYSGSYNYSDCMKQKTIQKKTRAKPNPKWNQLLASFAKGYELSDLVSAYKSFFRTRKRGGFFVKLASACGIENVVDIPKEFPDTEYEVKFDIQVYGKGQEPGIEQYLDAFDFPVGHSSRFLKDPVNTTATGINHFVGNTLDEKLVIIEKGGRNFLKEKGPVEPTNLGVPYEQIVIKRKESRYESSIDEIVKKFNGVTSDIDTEYRGKIRKEKGDAFILDANDGRIYSMSFTRAHLIKPDEKKESLIQRQLELEYAGYIPGFKGFRKDSEEQIVRDMVDLAKYTYAMYRNAPVSDGWRMSLGLTGERKYDFVAGIIPKALQKQESLISIGLDSRERETEKVLVR